MSAVDGLWARIEPGSVTGFLGPNGAGKSTTMRCAVGLVAPSSGRVTVAGTSYRRLKYPLLTVGALLDGGAAHPARRARDHVRAIALSNRIGAARVSEVLELVGLADVAHRRVGTFSLGMRQRLGLAVALLGDPSILVLDEPINGLDPEGVRWFRLFVRDLAAQGRTVLVSSHLMSEMEQTADRLIVVARGRLLADTTVTAVAGRYSEGVVVRTPQRRELSVVLRRHGCVVVDGDDDLRVTGADVDAIASIATDAGVRVHEIRHHHVSLEDAYLRLVADAEVGA
ncbi:ATP-binding cassette domain-containing protein [Stackebrandtia soli]|uniref:ATP-binding cassette domain-containing protein n=1 Tax=Stackebrandtia soli TaxID=1892856 RepID=UPI0039E762AF